jgi:8-oxo-dGTP pyrophosphatase MutT (NUDIX family)
MQKALTIVQVERDLAWLPLPNECITALCAQLPPGDMIDTAFVLAFAGDRLLQVNLVQRGWDLPGGHREAGETPAAAARREVYEETGARLGQLHLLGHQRLHLLGPRPMSPRHSYPQSYQVFYWAQITALDTRLPDAETCGAGLFSPDDTPALPWVQAHRPLYTAALSAASGRREALTR